MISKSETGGYEKTYFRLTDTTSDAPPAYTASGTARSVYTTRDSFMPSAFSTQGLTDDPSVQVCPHQGLSFSRFQRIMNLPDFKNNRAKLDCLTPASDYHHRGHDKDSKECQDSCKPLSDVSSSGIIGTLKGFGTYAWKNTGSHSPGLVLSFHWEMKCLSPGEVTYRAVHELKEYLTKANVQLCPHKRLDDLDIVNAIHPIVNTDGVPADPIDRYLAKQESKDCKFCDTTIKVYMRTGGIAGKTCRVDTKRYLGSGKDNETQWGKQCADSGQAT